VKQHRWVAQTRVPVKLYANEDKKWFIRTPPQPIDLSQWPMMVWCFDCEEPADRVFGQPCEGYLSTGLIDDSMSDSEWSSIK
jgi:hypothetical protein